MPGGRPPEPVPQDLAESLLEWLANGKTLTTWLRQPGSPSSMSTIYNWIRKDPEFAADFARVRCSSAMVLMDEAQDILDDNSGDWIVDDKGAKTLDREHISRSKERAAFRAKRAACFAPESFGLRIQHGGIPDAPPIKFEQSGPTPPPMNDYQDPVTGRKMPGLLTSIAKLHALAQEHIGASESVESNEGDEDPS